MLEVTEKKDNVEIVGWRYAGERQLEELRKQAEREDGQLLILTSDNEVSSVARPTHSEEARAATDNTSSTGKDTQISDNNQTNPQQSATDEGKTLHSLPSDATPEEPGYPLRDFITDPLDWTDPYEAFRRPRTAALELSRMTDAELLERTRTAEAGTHDWNFFNDEYDRRHRQEYADLTDHYRAILEQTQPTLDDAYAMLAAADQHFHYGGHARPERTELLAQRHTLQNYIDRKEAVFQIQKTNITE